VAEVEPQTSPPAAAAASSSAVRKLLSVASGTAVLQFGSYGFSLISTLLLTHFLGRSDYGVYTLATSWATLLALPAILGLNRFLVRGLAVYIDRGQWPLARGLLLRSNHLVIVSSTVMGLVAAAAWTEFGSASVRVAIAIAMIMVPINNLVLLRQGAMQALGRVMSGQIPEYVIRPVLFIVLILGLYFAHSAALTGVSAVMLMVISTLIASSIGATWLLRSLPAPLRSGTADYRTGEWARAALPMMLVASVNAINNQVSILLVGGILGHKEAGVFNLAETGATITALVLSAAVMPLAPEIARLYARGDLVALEHTCRRVAQWALLGSLPLALVFAALPRLVLSVFGHGYSGGAVALSVMSLAQLVNSATGPAGNVLVMSGRERLAAMDVGVGMVSNIAFSAVLIPVLGVTGGALGEAASIVAFNALNWYLVRRTIGINAAAFGPRLLRSAA
jgi:O-antigen/teichoic acid export membrane protein